MKNEILNETNASNERKMKSMECKSVSISKFPLLGLSLAGLLPFFGISSVFAQELPSGGVISSGAATITSGSSVLNIDQSTQRAAINWQSFSIGDGATVNFNQPNSSAVTLNRVVGNEQSVISGALNANGQVFLTNSNGVLFTKGAEVNVGGMVASALDLSDQDFMEGKSTFSKAGTAGSVLNFGTLTAADGGYIALLGNQVKNEGAIVAKLGSAVMAAGEKVTLNFNSDSLVGVTVDKGALDALVQNGSAVHADGGMVVLTAKGVDDVLSGVVNNTGEVRAQTIQKRGGRIFLMGDMGTGQVNVGGTLDASAPNGGDGGFIETSAAKVKIVDNVQITTKSEDGKSGEWLIDPVDFTIAATGGDITGAALASLLNSGNVTIETATGTNTANALFGTTGTNGDIIVDDVITKTASGETSLTLKADNSIVMNADREITSTGGALNIYLSANNGGSNGGAVTFNSGAKLQSNGGDIIVGGALSSGLPSTTNEVGVEFKGNNTVSAGAGDVSIYGKGVNFSGNYTTLSGENVVVSAGSGFLDAGSSLSNYRKGISFDANTSLSIEGRSVRFWGPAGYAYTDRWGYGDADYGFLDAEDYFSLSARDSINIKTTSEDNYGSMEVVGLVFKMMGEGLNQLTLDSARKIDVRHSSAYFNGTPDLVFGVDQTTTYNSAFFPFSDYVDAFKSLPDGFTSVLKGQSGYLNTQGAHFGLGGAAYTIKVGKPSDPASFAITQKANVLDNGYFALGDGLTASASFGAAQDYYLLQDGLTAPAQPFYFDEVLKRWIPLSYANHSIGMGFSVGGEADSAGWQSAFDAPSDSYATTDQNYSMSRFAIKKFIEGGWDGIKINDSGVTGGVGSIIVSYVLNLSGNRLRVENKYTLVEGGKFVRGEMFVENLGQAPVNNFNVWVGIPDDFIGTSDSTVKTIGNLADGEFTIGDIGSNSNAIVISEDVLGSSPSNGGASAIFNSLNLNSQAIVSYWGFSDLVDKDPGTVTSTGTQKDSAYGMFMNFGEFTSSAPAYLTWYYGGEAKDQISDLYTAIGADAAGENERASARYAAGGYAIPSRFAVTTINNESNNGSNGGSSDNGSGGGSSNENNGSGTNTLIPNGLLSVLQNSSTSSSLNLSLGSIASMGNVSTLRPTTFSNVAVTPSVVSSVFGPGAKLSLISSPRGDELTQVVSFSEAAGMLAPNSGRSATRNGTTSSANGGANAGANGRRGGSSASAQDGQGASGTNDGNQSDDGTTNGDNDGAANGDREVRVPASNGSLVDIVNGGVRLPNGVDQQLFVVESN